MSDSPRGLTSAARFNSVERVRGLNLADGGFGRGAAPSRVGRRVGRPAGVSLLLRLCAIGGWASWRRAKRVQARNFAPWLVPWAGLGGRIPLGRRGATLLPSALSGQRGAVRGGYRPFGPAGNIPNDSAQSLDVNLWLGGLITLVCLAPCCRHRRGCLALHRVKSPSPGKDHLSSDGLARLAWWSRLLGR